jgi:hypothetical protein
LELQKISLDIDPETDPFLKAIDKIRKEQDDKLQQEEKKEKLRFKNASRWK